MRAAAAAVAVDDDAIVSVLWCRQATGDVFVPPALLPGVLKSRI